MFGDFVWNAGVIFSCQIDRSSLRQLSNVRLTWAPPALAAGCDVAGPLVAPDDWLALVHAPSAIASAAATARNRRFKVLLLLRCSGPMARPRDGRAGPSSTWSVGEDHSRRAKPRS